jgi:hypothetical protein
MPTPEPYKSCLAEPLPLAKTARKVHLSIIMFQFCARLTARGRITTGKNQTINL